MHVQLSMESMALWLLGEDCPVSIIPTSALQRCGQPTFEYSHFNYESSCSDGPGTTKPQCIRLDAPRWRKGSLHYPTYLNSIRMQCAMALSYLNILWLATLSISDCSFSFRCFSCVSRTLSLHTKQHRYSLIWQLISH